MIPLSPTLAAQFDVFKPKQKPRTKNLAQAIYDNCTEEEQFRYAYVPYVIGEMVWDFTDTILTLSSLMKLRPVRPLCRAVRELRREYERDRSPYYHDADRRMEHDIMEEFIDGIEKDLSGLSRAIVKEIHAQHPDLRDDYVPYLNAVYQAMIVLDSLFGYHEYMSRKISGKIGVKLPSILAKELYKLRDLLPEFAGDCRLDGQESFVATYKAFQGLLTNRIKQTELIREK